MVSEIRTIKIHVFLDSAVVCRRKASGNDVRRATARALNLLSHSGDAIGCQDARDKNERCWGAFGSRKQFVDMHNR